MSIKKESEASKTHPIYSSLDAIDSTNTTQCLLLRLIRLWEVHDFKKNDVLLSLDCLFVDTKANAIQASIHARRIHKFKSKLKEGTIYSIKTLDIKENRNYYRLTKNEYKLFFTDHTTIDDVVDAPYNIPNEYFCVRQFAEVKMMADKGEQLLDIIAQVTRTRSSYKTDRTKANPKTTKNLLLTCTFDSGDIAYISLWGKVTAEIEEELAQLKGGPIVTIATGLNPKTVGGHLYLNATASTRLFFNMDNVLTNDFRMSTHYQDNLCLSIELEESEPTPTDIKSISHILAYVSGQEGPETKFWCTAKIVDVILVKGWFYISCTQCNKKMSKKDSKISCSVCNADRAIGLLRYRVEVIVDDGRDTTTFVIFDSIGETLFKTTAADLASRNDVRDDDDCGNILPQTIADLVGKSFSFHIKVANYNFTARHQSFAINEIAMVPLNEPKKRTERCESSTEKSLGLPATTPTNKIVSKKHVPEAQEIKKPRTSRKKKSKVVIEEESGAEDLEDDI